MKINQDYILLILNCKKYVKKAIFQKKTWLPKLPNYLIYFHVIGEPNMDVNFKFDSENKILFVKTEDDYISLPKKVMAAYNAINQTYDYKYIYKTDDDQILTNDKFFDIITKITQSEPKIHYGGYIVDVKQNYLSEYHKIHPELPKFLPILQTKYCSGRFYFLSNEVINDILLNKLSIENEYLEDYAVGKYMKSIFKLNMINIATNKYFTDIELSDYPQWVKEGKI